MLRTATIAVAIAFSAASFAPSATAKEEQINLDIRVDPTEIVDLATANEALASVTGQATKACSYFRDSNRRTYTDEKCVNEILDQVVAAINNEDLTTAYEESQGSVQVAEKKD